MEKDLTRCNAQTGIFICNRPKDHIGKHRLYDIEWSD